MTGPRFVQPPGGSHNLWDLVAVIKGQDDSLLPQNYGQGIMHMKHLVRFKTVRADGLQITSYIPSHLHIVWP